MAKKILNLCIALEVEDLPDDQRHELEAELGATPDYPLADLQSIDAKELSKNIILSMLDLDWQQQSVWAASDMFAQFGAIKLVSAEWQEK